ncbi:type II toxin-antitoxin system HicB family antitoxin [candidate division KSB3 bacterium]|uniref:Type II toxin-antitoxin system HicB family antitoxin n=1 Tax=candidate division KSB3 bacterium TaxID=2044937 RepID=A0A9D5JU14_9BACT|nr:type II toxin-antitoxin system HicB family antitoxin [candidate division KSB3 bacterium]MBD3324227.1 type II toxin-antitoxin system HicB family antitoxin [candidate division KSB3 bacterium]
MERYFTLEYWVDDAWYVGKLREVPGVFSQGETLNELIENIRDAYQLLLSAEPSLDESGHQQIEIEIPV